MSIWDFFDRGRMETDNNKNLNMDNMDDDIDLLMELRNDILSGVDSVKEEIRYLRQDMKDLQPSPTSLDSNVVHSDDMANDIKDILSKLASLQIMGKQIDDIDYNIRNQSASSYSEDYVKSLQVQIDDYREDVFLKLMKKYFVNVYIGVYRYVALLRFQAIRDGSQFNNIEIEGVLKEIEEGLSSVGIKALRTPNGGDFNIKEMTLSDKFPRVSTKEENKKGKVAFSVLPRFLFKRTENADSLVFNREEVALFEDSIDNN